MKKCIALLLMTPVFVFAGGDLDSNGLPSKGLPKSEKSKYTQHSDPDDAKKRALANAKVQNPEEKQSKIFALFRCCCCKVEKN